MNNALETQNYDNNLNNSSHDEWQSNTIAQNNSMIIMQITSLTACQHLIMHIDCGLSVNYNAKPQWSLININKEIKIMKPKHKTEI